MRSRSDQSLQTALARSSQGGPVKLVVQQAGPNVMRAEIGIDYSRAEIPDRAYYADYCSVHRGRVGFTLTFGKLLGGEQAQLRTKIEVIFPETMFRQQLWASSQGIREVLALVNADSPLSQVGDVRDTDKVQTVRANNVFMAVWGEEALLDFYYISPRDLFLGQQGKGRDIDLQPVIRVALDSLLLQEFLNQCGPLQAEASADGSIEASRSQEIVK